MLRPYMVRVAIAFDSKRAIAWSVRVNTRWATGRHEERCHHSSVNRSFIARDPHHPAVLKERGTGGVHVRGTGGIVSHVERDRSACHGHEHGAGMIMPT